LIGAVARLPHSLHCWSCSISASKQSDRHTCGAGHHMRGRTLGRHLLARSHQVRFDGAVGRDCWWQRSAIRERAGACQRTRLVVSRICAASLRNSSVLTVPMVHLLCCTLRYQRSGTKPRQDQPSQTQRRVRPNAAVREGAMPSCSILQSCHSCVAQRY
jgi:hypothetical protein